MLWLNHVVSQSQAYMLRLWPTASESEPVFGDTFFKQVVEIKQTNGWDMIECD